MRLTGTVDNKQKRRHYRNADGLFLTLSLTHALSALSLPLSLPPPSFTLSLWPITRNPGGCHLDSTQTLCNALSSFQFEGPPLTEQHHDKLAAVTHYFGGNFFHSMMELLPRLMLLKERLDTDPDVSVLIHPGVHRLVTDALHALGLQGRTIEIRPGTVYHVSGLQA